MDRTTKLLELLDDFKQMYEKEAARTPSTFNVIDELHANENAHTRILLQLLRYKRGNSYAFLQSFIDCVMENSNAGFSDAIVSPEISFNSEMIDGLIEEKNKYGIIIENKIHFAVDQYKQIDTYVARVIAHGIPKDKVYVVYLTSDGSKKISEYSMSEETKKLLGERYIAIDYRTHILPWLKTQVYPMCYTGEEVLTSAVRQYIDHLEGMFNLRPSQQSILFRMKDDLLKALNVTPTMGLLEKLNLINNTISDLNAFSADLRTLSIELKKPIADEFCSIWCEMIKQTPDFDIETKGDLVTKEFFYVTNKRWRNSGLHFEWYFAGQDLLSEYSYLLVLHVEGGAEKTIGPAVVNDPEMSKYCKSLKWCIWEKTYETHRQVPFASLDAQEKREFLKDVYEDIFPMLLHINRIAEEIEHNR